MRDDATRDRIAQEIEREVRPLLDVSRFDGGYNCCGCTTYDQIVDHCLRIVRNDGMRTFS